MRGMSKRRRRRSTDPGHRRRLLVVIDDTPECSRAVRFAARRAEHTDGGLMMLAIIPPPDTQTEWRGVESLMRAEAIADAEKALERAVDEVRSLAPHVTPGWKIREGAIAAEILNLIEEDEDIAVLVLAAGTGTEGPGPLVSGLAARASGTFPVPITIVPGDLSDEEIDALA